MPRMACRGTDCLPGPFRPRHCVFLSPCYMGPWAGTILESFIIRNSHLRTSFSKSLSRIRMTELQDYVSQDIRTKSLEEEPIKSLEVPLFMEENDEDGFRTENTSRTDYERRNIIERTAGAIHIRCDLIDVVHGSFDQDSGDYATLMILRFRFDPQKQSRRVIRARINIEFFATTKGAATPEVYAITPEERWTVTPTTDHEETVKGVEAGLGAAGAAIVDASVKAKLERTVTRDISDATTVTGSINLGQGKNSGISTCAAWNLLENKRHETGVPDSVQVAVLLRREDNELFNGKVTMDADVDFFTSIKKIMSSKVPLDDPILFNPKLEYKTSPRKSEKVRTHGTNNLSAVDRESLCEVRMAVEAHFASWGKK